MDEQNRNLILAMVLSSLVLLIWYVMFPPEVQSPAALEEQEISETVPGAVPSADPETGATSPEVGETEATVATIPIQTPSLEGSLSLAGGRIEPRDSLRP